MWTTRRLRTINIAAISSFDHLSARSTSEGGTAKPIPFAACRFTGGTSCGSSENKTRFTNPWMVQMCTLVSVSGVTSLSYFKPKMSANV